MRSERSSDSGGNGRSLDRSFGDAFQGKEEVWVGGHDEYVTCLENKYT